jgi:spore maturation protein CgeB
LHDVRRAYSAPRWLRTLLWRLAGRRPARLGAFSREVVAACVGAERTHLLATGLAPIRAEELRALGGRGVTRMNYLSDDPWNPAHRAPWFLAALREYDVVFNPRRQNLEDLRQHGCRRVVYLPFGYDPVLHAPAEGATAEERVVDVLFAGGADADRLPYARTLVAAGLNVALYGGYWDRHADLRPHWRGLADLATLCRVTPAARLVLCLVRRANRDGHAMRSFEAPAMRGCLLMEDTPEHRELFGADGECVVFFRDIPEMVAKAKALLPRAEERARLAAAAHRRICSGGHTYADRLRTMLAE